MEKTQEEDLLTVNAMLGMAKKRKIPMTQWQILNALALNELEASQVTISGKKRILVPLTEFEKWLSKVHSPKPSASKR